MAEKSCPISFSGIELSFPTSMSSLVSSFGSPLSASGVVSPILQEARSLVLNKNPILMRMQGLDGLSGVEDIVKQNVQEAIDTAKDAVVDAAREQFDEFVETANSYLQKAEAVAQGIITAAEDFEGFLSSAACAAAGDALGGFASSLELPALLSGDDNGVSESANTSVTDLLEKQVKGITKKDGPVKKEEAGNALSSMNESGMQTAGVLDPSTGTFKVSSISDALEFAIKFNMDVGTVGIDTQSDPTRAQRAFTNIEYGDDYPQLRYQAKIPRAANSNIAFGDGAVFDDRERTWPGGENPSDTAYSGAGVSYGVVELAPRKIIPDFMGGGVEVSENWPLVANNVESNVSRLARGISLRTNPAHTFTIASTPVVGKRIELGLTFPEDPYGAVYPYNSVRETESGHIFEADDTPGRERIKESHRIGTYYEVYPDGTKVTRVLGDNYELTANNKAVHIQGACFVTVDGDCYLYSKGNLTQQVDGDYNLWVKGRYNVKVDGDEAAFVTAGSYDENIATKRSTKIGGDYQLEVQGNESHIIGTETTSRVFGPTGKTLSGNRSLVVMASENKVVGINSNLDVSGQYNISSTFLSIRTTINQSIQAGLSQSIACGAAGVFPGVLSSAGSAIYLTPVSITQQSPFHSRSGYFGLTSAVIQDTAGVILLNT